MENPKGMNKYQMKHLDLGKEMNAISCDRVRTHFKEKFL